MPTNTAENHLSKDELMEILNEIDTEQHNELKVTNDQAKEKAVHRRYPNPGNQFY